MHFAHRLANKLTIHTVTFTTTIPLLHNAYQVTRELFVSDTIRDCTCMYEADSSIGGGAGTGATTASDIDSSSESKTLSLGLSRVACGHLFTVPAFVSVLFDFTTKLLF